MDESFEPAFVEHWQEYEDMAYSFQNANHIGFGRYKSPASSRGMSPVYGVPLNFGCAAIEEEMFHDLELINAEFENGKSVIFADPRILLTDQEKAKYTLAENIFPVHKKAGEAGNYIDIFNPSLRYSEHYSKLVADMALYEKEIGTSKGFLTDNETSDTATATAVRRANADTVALLNKIRNAIDYGNKMTLEADAVFLNIADDLWEYVSDWFDPFEDAGEQWDRLMQGKESGAAEASDLMKWLFPKLSEEEIEEKIQRINSQQQSNADTALENILTGQ